jgi:hypothetical protein
MVMAATIAPSVRRRASAGHPQGARVRRMAGRERPNGSTRRHPAVSWRATVAAEARALPAVGRPDQST